MNPLYRHEKDRKYTSLLDVQICCFRFIRDFMQYRQYIFNDNITMF